MPSLLEIWTLSLHFHADFYGVRLSFFSQISYSFHVFDAYFIFYPLFVYYYLIFAIFCWCAATYLISVNFCSQALVVFLDFATRVSHICRALSEIVAIYSSCPWIFFSVDYFLKLPYTTHVKHVFASNLILLLNLNDTFLLYRFTSSAIRQRLFIFTLTKVNIVLYHQVQFASHSAMQVLHFLNLFSAQWQFSLGRQFGLFGLYGCSLYLVCSLVCSVSAKWQFELGMQ